MLGLSMVEPWRDPHNFWRLVKAANQLCCAVFFRSQVHAMSSHGINMFRIHVSLPIDSDIDIPWYTSSTAQGGGGGFQNGKPMGKGGSLRCMDDRAIHWKSECLLILSFFLCLSFWLSSFLFVYSYVYMSRDLPTCLSMHLRASTYLSMCLSIFLFTNMPLFKTNIQLYVWLFVYLFA